MQTTAATNLVYDLNGSPVSVGIGAMVFFNSSFGGLFEIVFTDSNFLAAFGPDIGSTGTIETGTFSAGYGMNAVSEPSPPQASGDVLVGPVATPTPEPSAVALLATSILALALIRRRYPGS
jgi:hypothetical protein